MSCTVPGSPGQGRTLATQSSARSIHPTTCPEPSASDAVFVAGLFTGHDGNAPDGATNAVTGLASATMVSITVLPMKKVCCS